MTLYRWLFASVVLATLLAARPDAQAAAAQPVARLDVLLSGRVEILDPHATATGASFAVLEHVYEPLLRPAEVAGGAEQPCLALRWEASKDFTRWTFDLREGVKFHDGSLLNAQAVQGSFQRWLLPDHKAQPRSAPYRSEFDGVATIEVLGQYRIAFQLKQADSTFPSLLTLPSAVVMSQPGMDALAALTIDKRANHLNGTTYGTGPYRRVKQEPQIDTTDNWLELNAHEAYWGGKPSVAVLRFKTMMDASSRAKAVQSAEADVAEWPANAVWSALERDNNVSLVRRPANAISYLAMNCWAESKQPTVDIRVRRAIALAIDRKALLESLDPGEHALHTLIPPGVLGHPADYKPELDRLDRADALKKAKELVAEAELAGPLTLLAPNVPRPYLPQPTTVADSIRLQLAEVGIEVAIEIVPLREIVERIAKRDFALILIGWMGVDSNRPAGFWRHLLSGKDRPGDNNFSGFFDKAVAAAIEDADRQPTHALRAKGFEALEKTVHDTHRPIVPLAWHEQAWVWRNKLRGIQVGAGGRLRFFDATTD